MGIFNRLKRAWEIWQEVVEERKRREKEEAAKNTPDKFKKCQDAMMQRINLSLQYRAAIKKIEQDAKKGDLASVISGIENVVNNTEDIPKKDELSAEEIKNALYTAGKNQAAIVYAKHGVDPVNLAFIVHGIAKNQEKLLDEKLDYEDCMASMHQHMIGLAKTYLRSVRGKPNSASELLSAMQRAEQILELANYTPEDKQAHTIELNKLLVGALLPNLKALAHKGLISEFDDISAKVCEAMDASQTPAEMQGKIKGLLNIYLGKCYNAHFVNHANAFTLGVISLEDLEKITRAHNGFFARTNISREDIEKNRLHPVARLNSNSYRIGINQLLYLVDPASRNGNPIPPEKEARELADKIKIYLKKAELKPVERKGVIKALKRIDSFYNGHSTGQNLRGRDDRNQMYTNPLYDRRARLAKKHR
ncbi:hypothetical protein KY338_02855 [Candidatus Woesearchaeota archaeon]|nr:hypothetical protein [Candidatus Woesearchaeota archaeon]MBW3005702.1 hypothetical protein [Candidatus Woesearchaeota archaeon]